jgi:hypothetical protein
VSDRCRRWLVSSSHGDRQPSHVVPDEPGRDLRRPVVTIHAVQGRGRSGRDGQRDPRTACLSATSVDAKT